MNDNLELAFSFTAAEFMEEELEDIKEVLPEFVSNGEYRHSEDTMYHYEFWARREDIDKLNAIIAEREEERRVKTLKKLSKRERSFIKMVEKDRGVKFNHCNGFPPEFVFYDESGDFITFYCDEDYKDE